jgi:hypothetical protein
METPGGVKPGGRLSSVKPQSSAISKSDAGRRALVPARGGRLRPAGPTWLRNGRIYIGSSSAVRHQLAAAARLKAD